MDIFEMTPFVNMAEEAKEDTASISGVDFSFFSSGEAVFTDPTEEVKEKTTRKRKAKNDHTELVPARYQNQSVPVGEVNYRGSYDETTAMLRTAIAQTDQLSAEIKEDIDKIRSSSTLKNKYTYLTNLTGSEASLIGTKIQAIREINSTITQAHNLELNRLKTLKENEADQTDESRMMDLYKAFVNTPVGTYANPNPAPTVYDMTGGVPSGAIAGIQMGGTGDLIQGQLSPEQVRMRMESMPNIQTVVKFNQSTGERYFDVIDTNTGASVPNYPRPDNFLLENTILDVRALSARNKNLDTVWPLVLIGNGNISEY